MFNFNLFFMETIIKFMHYLIASVFTVIAFCLDVIFKLTLGIIFGVFAVILICIYPLIKNYYAPQWICFLYDYVVIPYKSICVKVWHLWTENV